ncbi:hypothetical protein C8J56DRAFT_272227 [Mycena floridula]|nr:hypothetical protein C8J56DRAFT_272227 [Mycena floridula]
MAALPSPITIPSSPSISSPVPSYLRHQTSLNSINSPRTSINSPSSPSTQSSLHSLRSPSSQTSLRTASSSAVTIITPGKSILKKAPVVKEGLWGRVVGRFGNNKGNESDSDSIRSGSHSDSMRSESHSDSMRSESSMRTESPSRSESPLPDGRSGSRSSTMDSFASVRSTASGASLRSRPDPTLKRAHFVLPSISVIYPISSSNPPSYPGVREEKRGWEERERRRRRRVLTSPGSHTSSASVSSGGGYTPTSAGAGQSISGQEAGAGLPNQAPIPNSAPGYFDIGKPREEPEEEEEEYWEPSKVESFYRECCAGIDETPDEGIRRAFLRMGGEGRVPGSRRGSVSSVSSRRQVPSGPRTLDLSGVQLTPTSAQILADVLCIEWGLRRLICKECDLEEGTLKVVLHALLVESESGSQEVMTEESPYRRATLASRVKKRDKQRGIVYLSLESNKRLGGKGGGILNGLNLGGLGGQPTEPNAYKMIAAFIARASRLEFLDLSQNPLDKKSVEWLVGVLPLDSSSELENADEQSRSLDYQSRSLDYQPRSLDYQPRSLTLRSLRLDDCQLRHPALETLCRGIRGSGVRNVSLRWNKINASGAVALALMIRDYPDVMPAGALASPPLSAAGTATPTGSFSLSTPTGFSMASLGSAIGSATGFGVKTPLASAGVRPSLASAGVKPPLASAGARMPESPLASPSLKGPLLPPPKRVPAPSAASMTTTYTPYVPRAKRAATVSSPTSGSPFATPPLPTTTPAQYQTTTGQYQTATSQYQTYQGATTPGTTTPNSQAHSSSLPSAALLDKVRALDGLPRIGQLRTLDLRGNDLRNGVTYLAQVLKRNRTLKVLNLAENKIDVAGLGVIADALKYNSSLETLDLSRNPCCGPLGGGIGKVLASAAIPASVKAPAVAAKVIASAPLSAAKGTLEQRLASASRTGAPAVSRPGMSPRVSAAALESQKYITGIQALRAAFTMNTALKRLFLGGTGMTGPGAIALAEFLPESRSLLHLDLTGNRLEVFPEEEAGLDSNPSSLPLTPSTAAIRALSAGLKHNTVMRCLDLDIPAGVDRSEDPSNPASVEEFARVCREILGWCVRNTVEAERVQEERKAESLGSLRTPTESIMSPTVEGETASLMSPAGETNGASGFNGVSSAFNGDGTPTPIGLPSERKSKVWNMLHGSELAKSVREMEERAKEGGKERTKEGGKGDIVAQARLTIQALSSTNSLPSTNALPSTNSLPSPKSLLASLTTLIERTDEAERLVELFEVFEGLRNLLDGEVPKTPTGTARTETSGDESSNEEETGVKENGDVNKSPGRKPNLTLDLPAGNPAFKAPEMDSAFKARETDSASSDSDSFTSMQASDGLHRDESSSSHDSLIHSRDSLLHSRDSLIHSRDSLIHSRDSLRHSYSDGEEEITTPRLDKGKARAPTPPIEHESVLSPVLGGAEFTDTSESEGEYDSAEDSEPVPGADPQSRSKSWVAEEGEVFRKGTVLLGPEEMEGEYAGEDLRRELLEAMVERPPPRNVDEEGMNVDEDVMSPANLRVQLSQSSTQTTPTPAAPPPRPYISRARSSSASIMSIVGNKTS